MKHQRLIMLLIEPRSINRNMKLKNGGNKFQLKKQEDKALYDEEQLDEELSFDDEDEQENKILMTIIKQEKAASQFKSDLKS